jgi:hypothetical protein
MIQVVALPDVRRRRGAPEASLAPFFARLHRRLWTEVVAIAISWPRLDKALVALIGPRWALGRWRVSGMVRRALADPLRTILVGHGDGARIVHDVARVQPVGLLVTMGTGSAALGYGRHAPAAETIPPASPWLHLGRPGDPWAGPVSRACMIWLPDRGLGGLDAHDGTAYWTEDAAEAIARAWHRRHDEAMA